MSEHITRDEFYRELAKFTDWVNTTNVDNRRRFHQIIEWIGQDMTTLGDDLGSLEGVVNDVESELAALKTATDAAVAKDGNDVASAASEHADILASHDRLSAIVANLRTSLDSAKSPAPEVVPPHPGNTDASVLPGGAVTVGSGAAGPTPVTGDPTQPSPTTPGAVTPVQPAGAPGVPAGDGSVPSATTPGTPVDGSSAPADGSATPADAGTPPAQSSTSGDAVPPASPPADGGSGSVSASPSTSDGTSGS